MSKNSLYLMNFNNRAILSHQYYDIFNKETNTIVKTGVSGGKIRKDGKSYRAEQQVRKWNKEKGGDVFESVITDKIPEGKGARDKILLIEKAKAKKYRDQGLLKDKYYHKIP